MSYTVVESHTDSKGTIVTFALRRRTLLDWLLRRPGESVTLQAWTEYPSGIVWHSFPSMHRLALETEMRLHEAWERHQLLERYSDD
jgi:hypothetical protein